MISVGSLCEHNDSKQKRQEELEQEVERKAKLEDPKEEAEEEYKRRGKRILLAAEKGRLMELSQHLREDPSLINFKDSDGYTPLHRASYGGHKDCVKYLLKKGANIDARTSDDWTPLHCAVRWNNIVIAEYLIEQGADINARSSGGNTPLHIVASNGRYSVTCDIIQLLLYHPNCDYSIKNNSGDTAFKIAKRSGPFYKFWNGVMTLRPGDDDEDDNGS